jgi:hypothetical protein
MGGDVFFAEECALDKARTVNSREEMEGPVRISTFVVVKELRIETQLIYPARRSAGIYS